jgi:[CysO sulfur-carrier protein]-S-L-cysteine hydrolase
LRLRNHDIDISLEVEENLLNRLYEYGMKSYPNEYGGVLVGQYSLDRKILFIQDTILTSKSGVSKYYFVRSNDGLKAELERRFNQESKQIYVGEWHTHPDMPAYPSFKDRDAMKSSINHQQQQNEFHLQILCSI